MHALPIIDHTNFTSIKWTFLSLLFQCLFSLFIFKLCNLFHEVHFTHSSGAQYVHMYKPTYIPQSLQLWHTVGGCVESMWGRMLPQGASSQDGWRRCCPIVVAIHHELKLPRTRFAVVAMHTSEAYLKITCNYSILSTKIIHICISIPNIYWETLQHYTYVHMTQYSTHAAYGSIVYLYGYECWLKLHKHTYCVEVHSCLIIRPYLLIGLTIKPVIWQYTDDRTT